MKSEMDMNMDRKRVVVLGAGVSGLTTALLLSRSTFIYDITIVAKHMPGDYDVDYCSPWAGADFMPTTCEGDSISASYHRRTWPWFRDLAETTPEAGVHFELATQLTRLQDEEAGRVKFPADPWWRGAIFTTVCINTAIYLPWLVTQCLAEGITFERRTITHISSAFSLLTPNCDIKYKLAEVLINCTGLGSQSLGGVEDKSMYPVRGQVALVRNSIIGNGGIDADGNFAPAGFSVSGTDDGEYESCYGMTRAAGGGTVLGGCSQVGNWDRNVDLALAERMLERARGFCGVASLHEEDRSGEVERIDKKGGQWDVVRHGVGLRPAREGGVRVEKEYVDLSIGGTDAEKNKSKGGDLNTDKGWVVHNYGHAGEGYQTSVGCAEDAVALVESVFRNSEAGT